jgi:uncharacterized protein YlaI
MTRKPVVGKCALCLQVKELQDSHFAPKALYRCLRMPSGDNPDPVVITKETARLTSKQIKDYLLCCDCEQRFSQEGESWVLRNFDRGSGQFTLQSLLLGREPKFALPSVKLIPTTQIPAIDTRKLAYFAASVIWRAGAHRWRFGNEQVKPIEITPEHLESLRLYLLGETAWPREAYLWLSVAEMSQPEYRFFTPPYGGFDQDHYSFRFPMPGMFFALFMGSLVPPMIREACLANSPDKLIHLVPSMGDLFRQLGAQFSESTPVGAIREK